MPLHEQSVEKQELVEKLKRTKEVAKLSNYELADTVGVSERTIRRWLSGECLPSENQLEKIRKSDALFITERIEGSAIVAKKVASESQSKLNATFQPIAINSILYIKK